MCGASLTKKVEMKLKKREEYWFAVCNMSSFGVWLASAIVNGQYYNYVCWWFGFHMRYINIFYVAYYSLQQSKNFLLFFIFNVGSNRFPSTFHARD